MAFLKIPCSFLFGDQCREKFATSEIYVHLAIYDTYVTELPCELLSEIIH